MKSEMLTELACVIDFIRDRKLIMIETEHGKGRFAKWFVLIRDWKKVGLSARCLLFVNDNVSFAEGYDQQEVILDSVNEFAIKHKIEWGANKLRRWILEITRKRRRRGN